MATGDRLSSERVAEIKQRQPDKLLWIETEQLCDSHEVYRGFAQRFVDIYSGKSVNEEIAQRLQGTNATSSDLMHAQLFALFLEIVGPIEKKV